MCLDGLRVNLEALEVHLDRVFVVAGVGHRPASIEEDLGLGFIPVRKKGKLPFQTHEQEYDLEYGTATVAVHVDALKPGSRVLLIDDLLIEHAQLLNEMERRSKLDVCVDVCDVRVMCVCYVCVGTRISRYRLT